ncbi:MAG: hypothetical protein CL912_13995 [Deltaproteobacteria bacterium]|nr:hypothetical protein [Deltaproteobacteria bacterium]
MFPGEMLNFQVGISKVFKAFFFLGRNSNFSKQFSFRIRFRFIDSAEEGFRKSKEKVTPLASDGGFGGAGSFERLYYINTSDIHKLQVYLN